MNNTVPAHHAALFTPYFNGRSNLHIV